MYNPSSHTWLAPLMKSFLNDCASPFDNARCAGTQDFLLKRARPPVCSVKIVKRFRKPYRGKHDNALSIIKTQETGLLLSLNLTGQDSRASYRRVARGGARRPYAAERAGRRRRFSIVARVAKLAVVLPPRRHR